ncbi:MAG: tRNA (adenosine(37)-N6)-dimethylallyltransferase MiaA [Acidobacteriaceae bacterium]|jgi:tRNA dimethylallyltransferase
MLDTTRKTTLAPLVVVAGPTASGKTALALALAQQFSGEIVSCDSVAVYRGMEIGTAKPTLAERASVPHHLIDVFPPDAPCTAGDYSRLAREAIRGIAKRDRLPIVCGGTGLYLRALVDGLFPGPPRHEPLRARLRNLAQLRGPAHLHRILSRLDPAAARLIHANDAPKLIRAIEVTLAARQPITRQWQQQPRDPLAGFRILRLCLNPPRAELYARINRRAAHMFDPPYDPPQQGGGLVEETAQLLAQYGPDCRPLTSLGYAQAAALLRGELTRDQAIAAAQQGHRNYAKRQLTWFRKDPALHWLPGFGSDPQTIQQASTLVAHHLTTR